MELRFTPDQEAFIRAGIASGRWRTAEEAVREAMARWEESERTRAEILSAVDEAEADLQSGRHTDYTDETLLTLAAELKKEARESRKPKLP